MLKNTNYTENAVCVLRSIKNAFLCVHSAWIQPWCNFLIGSLCFLQCPDMRQHGKRQAAQTEEDWAKGQNYSTAEIQYVLYIWLREQQETTSGCDRPNVLIFLFIQSFIF